MNVENWCTKWFDLGQLRKVKFRPDYFDIPPLTICMAIDLTKKSFRKMGSLEAFQYFQGFERMFSTSWKCLPKGLCIKYIWKMTWILNKIIVAVEANLNWIYLRSSCDIFGIDWRQSTKYFY